MAARRLGLVLLAPGEVGRSTVPHWVPWRGDPAPSAPVPEPMAATDRLTWEGVGTRSAAILAKVWDVTGRPPARA